MKYAKPANAGLQSEPRPAGRRIAKLLNETLMVNAFIFDGQQEGTLVNDVYEFRLNVIAQLKKDGWRVRIKENDRYSVLPPKGW